MSRTTTLPPPLIPVSGTAVAPSPVTPAMVKIAQVITSGSAASVTFSAIPGTYTDLLITYMCRDTSAAVGQTNLMMQFNGDVATGNYQGIDQIGVTNATVLLNVPTGSVFGICIGNSPGSLSTANPLAIGDVLIPNYAQSGVFQKYAIGRSTSHFGSGGDITTTRAGFWIHVGNPAITSIVFPASATAFTDGSTFTLYGLG